MDKRIEMQDYLRLFEEMEVEENLFEKKLFGVYYWKLVRIYVFNNLAVVLGVMNSTHPNHTKGNKYSDLFNILKIRKERNALKLDHKSDVVVFRHQRRILVDGNYVEVNTEYLPCILPELKDKHVNYVETGIAFKNRNVDKNSSFLIINPFKSAICQFYYSLLSKCGTKKQELSNINSIIRKYFKIEYDVSPLIIRNVKGFKLTRTLSRKYFSKISPKIVYLVCSYGKEGIVESAHDLNLPIIEIQHGTISHFHMGYSFPQESKVPYFPDEILLYGEFWKKEASFPIPQSKLKVIGSPYSELQISHYKEIKKEHNSVLFISSGQYGKSLSHLATEYKKISPDSIVYYKLHPSEFGVWKDLYRELNEASEREEIKVVEDKINLYELFARSEYLVGVNSTAIYESFLLDVKVILFEAVGIDNMMRMIQDYKVPLIKTSEELTRMVKNYPLDVKIDRDTVYHEISIKQN